jgi:ubiquinone/menaquinone biosynthesis C-methylase UbiE
MLLRLYRQCAGGTGEQAAAHASVGVDVFDWGADCVIIENCRALPFEDSSFDTVSFVACINHIPERREALREAFRVLRPGGKLVVTMIGRLIGVVGHAIWWYSEDKHRERQDGEVMGMNPSQVNDLIIKAGFHQPQQRRFVYWLNIMFVACRP